MWFFTVGNGTGIRATTCVEMTDHRAKLPIFSGACTSLQCINWDRAECTVAYPPPNDRYRYILGDTVFWVGEAGVLYYILVHANPWSSGKFGLAIEECVPPDNDQCVNAIGPLSVGGSITKGSTALAATDYLSLNEDSDSERCGGNLIGLGPGVWFTVAGNGTGVRASANANETDYAAQLSVFSGGCNELLCIGWNSQRDASIWLGEAGEVACILVHGYGTNTAGMVFGLTIEELETPTNDGCVNALELSAAGDSLSGSTESATLESRDVRSRICKEDRGTPGIWFDVTGRGTALKLSSQFDVGGCSYPRLLSIYTGECDDLRCLGYGGIYNVVCIRLLDDANGCHWFAEESEVCHILLQRPEDIDTDDPGRFSLHPLEEFETLRNDRCVSASGPMPADGSIARGTAELATHDHTVGDYGRNNYALAVWHTTIGTGTSAMTASACAGLASRKGWQVSVYSGKCDDLQCIRWSHDSSSCSKVAWSSKDGLEECHIAVVSSDWWFCFSDAELEFEFDIEEDSSRSAASTASRFRGSNNHH
jgi:hypothetical protein